MRELLALAACVLGLAVGVAALALRGVRPRVRVPRRDHHRRDAHRLAYYRRAREAR